MRPAGAHAAALAEGDNYGRQTRRNSVVTPVVCGCPCFVSCGGAGAAQRRCTKEKEREVGGEA
jgi:hypothetical protein